MAKVLLKENKWEELFDTDEILPSKPLKVGDLVVVNKITANWVSYLFGMIFRVSAVDRHYADLEAIHDPPREMWDVSKYSGVAGGGIGFEVVRLVPRPQAERSPVSRRVAPVRNARLSVLRIIFKAV